MGEAVALTRRHERLAFAVVGNGRPNDALASAMVSARALQPEHRHPDLRILSTAGRHSGCRIEPVSVLRLAPNRPPLEAAASWHSSRTRSSWSR